MGVDMAFCTVCMNRAMHVKETFLKNMSDNLANKNATFYLLDYNSQDDLEDWVRSHLEAFIDTGRLVYYKTFEPESFSQSHSRNMIFRLAEHTVVCNVDADNYVGVGFATYVEEAFHDRNVFLSGAETGRQIGSSGIYGRICMKRTDFLSVRGYDESMTGYGFEDIDLRQRLHRLGLAEVAVDKRFATAIDHSNELRMQDEPSSKSIFVAAVRFINHWSSELLFFFSNGFFESVIVCDTFNEHSTKPDNALNIVFKNRWRYYLQKDSLKSGTWTCNANEDLVCTYDVGDQLQDVISPKVDRMTQIVRGKTRLNEMLMFRSVVTNRNKMVKNESLGLSAINDGGYGQGVVYKNFDYSKPIKL